MSFTAQLGSSSSQPGNIELGRGPTTDSFGPTTAAIDTSGTTAALTVLATPVTSAAIVTSTTAALTVLATPVTSAAIVTSTTGTLTVLASPVTTATLDTSGTAATLSVFRSLGTTAAAIDTSGTVAALTVIASPVTTAAIDTSGTVATLSVFRSLGTTTASIVSSTSSTLTVLATPVTTAAIDTSGTHAALTVAGQKSLTSAAAIDTSGTHAALSVFRSLGSTSAAIDTTGTVAALTVRHTRALTSTAALDTAGTNAVLTVAHGPRTLVSTAAVTMSCDAVLYTVNVAGEISQTPYDPIGTEQPLTPPVYVFRANADIRMSTHVVQTVPLVAAPVIAMSCDAVLYVVEKGSEYDPIGTEQPLTPPIYVFRGNADMQVSTHVVQTVSLVGSASIVLTPAAAPYVL